MQNDSNAQPGPKKIKGIFNRFRLNRGLRKAARRGDRQAVEKFLDKGANINAQNFFFGPALTLAAKKGHENVVGILLEHKADTEKLDVHFNTPLIVAAARGHAKIVERLLDGGANVNATSDDNCTALIAASMKGSAETVKILLAHGADAEIWGRTMTYVQKNTALGWARYKRHKEVIELLEAHERKNQPAPPPVKRPSGFNL